MTDAHALYHRWIGELWSGAPVAAELVTAGFVGHWPDHDVHGADGLQQMIDQTRAMFTTIAFRVEVGPLADGELVAGRWIGEGHTAEGVQRFAGNDILRLADGRFAEYWTASIMLP